MATKITMDETAGRMTVEKSKETNVVHFTPKIIMELVERGKLWTIKVQPRAKVQ